MAEHGQLEVLQDRISGVEAPPHVDSTTGQLTPRVAFPSVLQLTYDQELALVDHAMTRLDDMEKAMGRTDVIEDEWWKGEGVSSNSIEGAAESWMGRRSRFEALFENRVDWRPYSLPSPNIFEESNLVVPISRRICRQMIARAQNYFFATDPWFNATPEGMEDGELADQIDRYAKWKLNLIGSKRGKERIVKRAMLLGECVVKTTYQTRDQIYETMVKALVGAEGEAILDANGEMILERADWIDTETPGLRVLGSDGVTQEPEAPVYTDQKITKRHVIFEGPESLPIYYKDFLAPLDAFDLQQADCIAHLYDRRVMDLVDTYAKHGVFRGTDTQRFEQMKRTVDAMRTMLDNNSEPKSGSARNRDEEEEEDDAEYSGGGQPIVEMAEVMLWYDANGDGILENIVLLLDRKNRLPVHYNYVANMSPDGLRPVAVVRVNEVDDRWYGQGVMEMFDSTQTIVDLLVNRWNLSQSKAGRVDFWDPSKVLEGRDDPNLCLNWGQSYTTVPGVDVTKVLQSVYLNDVKFEALKDMLEFFMQMGMNESGVTNANDGAALGMDTAKLATGIRNIEKAGEELFAPFLSDLEPGLTDVLKSEILVLLANLNKPEVFSYFEGREQITATIDPADVSDVNMNVTMFMTRYKGEQKFQQMSQVAEIIERFYMLDPLVQVHVAEYYRGMIKALDQKINVDELIVPLPPLPPEQAINSGKGPQPKREMVTRPKPSAAPSQLDSSYQPSAGG